MSRRFKESLSDLTRLICSPTDFGGPAPLYIKRD
jgi:hypothetical protein